MTDTAFDPLIATLKGPETPRVWSLLVSVFGELTLEPGAQIPGASLHALVALLGVKPERRGWPCTVCARTAGSRARAPDAPAPMV